MEDGSGAGQSEWIGTVEVSEGSPGKKYPKSGELGYKEDPRLRFGLVKNAT
jgi:hypothetical protein